MALLVISGGWHLAPQESLASRVPSPAAPRAGAEAWAKAPLEHAPLGAGRVVPVVRPAARQTHRNATLQWL